MLKVKQILVKLGALKHKFIHIVLTDGDDTASEEPADALKGFFQRLGHELGMLYKNMIVCINTSLILFISIN